MKKKLPINTDDFPTVINEGCYFVDKSMFVADILQNTADTKLILRPRRFGKSLNMSMLKSFLEIGSPKELFHGLAVSELAGLCTEHQSRHPVIFLSFKDINARSFPKALDELALIISDEAKRLGIGNGCSELDNSENALFFRMSEKRSDETDIQRSLWLMTMALYRRHGKKAIVLIDEYDAPISQAYQMEYYGEMAALFRGMVGQALKSNPYVSFAVLTGVLRVSKESIFSGINNISVYSCLDEEYSAHFGFTEGEVAAMLGYYGFESRMPDMKEHYDGYRMGEYEVYNPWSVVRQCSGMLTNKNTKPGQFWVNTASNDLIRNMLGQDGWEALATIESLISGGTVNKMLSGTATYRNLEASASGSAVWEMMLMAGYLTWARNTGGHFYDLRAPNQEVKDALRMDVLEWAMSSFPISEDKAAKLYSALLSGNAQGAEETINDVLKKVLGVRDGVVVHDGFGIEYERQYHYIAAILLSCSGAWTVRSERESGDGYCDILCTSREFNTAIVIEEKFSAKSNNESLEKKAAEAMAQIACKRYAEGVNEYDTIVAVGIAYASRKCRVQIAKLKP